MKALVMALLLCAGCAQGAAAPAPTASPSLTTIGVSTGMSRTLRVPLYVVAPGQNVGRINIDLAPGIMTANFPGSRFKFSAMVNGDVEIGFFGGDDTLMEKPIHIHAKNWQRFDHSFLYFGQTPSVSVLLFRGGEIARINVQNHPKPRPTGGPYNPLGH
jgi:hypothetical protein